MRPEQKIRFIEPPKNMISKIFALFYKKYEVGYFHQFGFSGNQKNNERDIVIIEKSNGQLITIPKKDNLYELI